MSNRGLVTRFISALTSGDSKAVNELIAANATYQGPLAGQAAGTAPLNAVMNTLLNAAPLSWIVLGVVEDVEGAVALRRELRVAAGIAHAEVFAANIQIRGGKIAGWIEHCEKLLDTPVALVAEQGFTEADAAALIA